QARTRSTLEYLFTLPSVQKESKWLIEHLTANGLSSSRPVNNEIDINATANQRVEFRIVTNAEERMEKIAENLKESSP
ncbi:OmpA family protein, partial [Burkholderiaceae bacterium]|nr:OmpA family protein [Burkholderiaceae bacterium]